MLATPEMRRTRREYFLRVLCTLAVRATWYYQDIGSKQNHRGNFIAVDRFATQVHTGHRVPNILRTLLCALCG